MGPRTKVTAEHVQGIVGGHDVVCGVIHPYQTWPMPQISLVKYWNCIYIHILPSLDHYTTAEVHGSKILGPGTRVTAKYV